MANSWGELSWSAGSFGEQNNSSVQLDGISLSSSLGNVTIEIIVTNGWGALTWGLTDWGTNTGNPAAQVTGQSLTSILNNDGVSISLSPNVSLTGQLLTTNLDSVSLTGTANLTLDTNLAILSQGNAQGIPGVVVSVTAPGTATTWGSNGWGELGWGENIGLTTLEGTTTVDLITPVNVTGQLLSTSLNSVTINATGNLSLTGQVLTAQVSSVGITADGSVSIPVFENPLITALGDVDPGPDANITGQQLTLTQGDIDIDIAVVVQVTGQLLSTSLNSVTIDLNTPVDITGQNLTTAVNSVTVVLNTPVNVTGNSLTGKTGQLYVGAWAPVNTGQSIVWAEVAA
jgi:hypothetical protein